MRGTSRFAASAALGLAGLVAACGQSTKELLQTASLAVSPAASVHAEAPVEIYSRVARGALACWFGPNGGLKPTHVFHADVAPEAKGGEAEIVIHERDTGAPTPRSLRAYRIVIVRAGGGSQMTSENLKLPDQVHRDMQADAHRWARGETGCSVVGVGGWNAGKPATAEPEAAKAPPPKRRKGAVTAKSPPKKE